MVRRVSAIMPLLLITVLSVGGVEGGYRLLEYFLTKPTIVQRQKTVSPRAKERKNQDNIEIKHDYQIILERNIFGSSPAAKAEEEEILDEPIEDIAATTLNIILTGTVGGEEESRRAIIADQSSRTQYLYQEGDSVQGALIEEILRGKVILSYRGKKEILEMTDNNEGSGSTGPVAVMPDSPFTEMGAPMTMSSGSAVPRRVKPGIVKPARRVTGKKNDSHQPIE